MVHRDYRYDISITFYNFCTYLQRGKPLLKILWSFSLEYDILYIPHFWSTRCRKSEITNKHRQGRRNSIISGEAPTKKEYWRISSLNPHWITQDFWKKLITLEYMYVTEMYVLYVLMCNFPPNDMYAFLSLT